MPKTPSAEQQARFFVHLQHLLVEGEFVSTYKYALLIALTRWAVENPDHDESAALDVARLAEHFLAVYWPQVRPFVVAERLGEAASPRPSYGHEHRDAWSMVLDQDRGRQRPRVLRLILEEQSRGHACLRDVPEPRREVLLRQVAKTIREMPLWKLHTTSGGQSMQFLYRRGGSAGELVFEPGVIACLTEFSLLIEQVVRAAWLRFVLRCNPRVLGTAPSQLEEFLFPSGRSGLAVWRPVLERVQGSACFYCGGTMRIAEVDHFLPWSRYPRDLGHNFVLAHPKCNANKCDHLASAAHLARWCRRNDEEHRRMAEEFDRSGLPHDWTTLRRVAASLYHVAERSGADVWHRGTELVQLDSEWRVLLGA